MNLPGGPKEQTPNEGNMFYHDISQRRNYRPVAAVVYVPKSRLFDRYIECCQPKVYSRDWWLETMIRAYAASDSYHRLGTSDAQKRPLIRLKRSKY